MRTRDLIMPALFVAITSALAYITIPLSFSPVAVTGQTLGVMLVGALLSPRQAVLAMTAYLLLGTVGAPVFSGGTAGPGILVGPTGGYLLGFVPGAATISWLRGNSSKFPRLFAATLVGGLLVIYIPGTLWLSYVTGMGLPAALTISVLPYIPGDVLKALAAAAAGNRLAKLIEH